MSLCRSAIVYSVLCLCLGVIVSLWRDYVFHEDAQDSPTDPVLSRQSWLNRSSPPCTRCATMARVASASSETRPGFHGVRPVSHFAFDDFDWAGGMKRELRKTNASLHAEFDRDWNGVRGDLNASCPATCASNTHVRCGTRATCPREAPAAATRPSPRRRALPRPGHHAALFQCEVDVQDGNGRLNYINGHVAKELVPSRWLMAISRRPLVFVEWSRWWGTPTRGGGAARPRHSYAQGPCGEHDHAWCSSRSDHDSLCKHDPDCARHRRAECGFAQMVLGLPFTKNSRRLHQCRRKAF